MRGASTARTRRRVGDEPDRRGSMRQQRGRRSPGCSRRARNRRCRPRPPSRARRGAGRPRTTSRTSERSRTAVSEPTGISSTPSRSARAIRWRERRDDELVGLARTGVAERSDPHDVEAVGEERLEREDVGGDLARRRTASPGAAVRPRGAGGRRDRHCRTPRSSGSRRPAATLVSRHARSTCSVPSAFTRNDRPGARPALADVAQRGEVVHDLGLRLARCTCSTESASVTSISTGPNRSISVTSSPGTAGARPGAGRRTRRRRSRSLSCWIPQGVSVGREVLVDRGFQVNSAARPGPAARNRAARRGRRRFGRECSRPTAASSLGGTSTAASPTTSSMAEPVVVTSAAPHASASSAGSPNPSSSDGYATTSAWRKNAGSTASSIQPTRMIRVVRRSRRRRLGRPRRPSRRGRRSPASVRGSRRASGRRLGSRSARPCAARGSPRTRCTADGCRPRRSRVEVVLCRCRCVKRSWSTPWGATNVGAVGASTGRSRSRGVLR